MKNSTKQTFILSGIAAVVAFIILSSFVTAPHKIEGFVNACADNWNKHDVTASVGAVEPSLICSCIAKHMSKNNAELVHFTTITAWFAVDRPNTASHSGILFGQQSDDLFMDGLLHCVNNQ